ncbi:hypothetical protein LBMAG56_02030 [Verrucomicrobiota bacterium]|nr:hypothetical protein LBMAG56_02030 [Verrucomicrobiota bacterium]
MQKQLILLLSLVPFAALFTGCGGMEAKLGRGINNVMEIGRLGEFRRSVEQTSVWEGSETGMTVGTIRGVHRTLARTLIGVGEIVSSPFPTVVYENYEWPNKFFMDPSTRVKAEPFSVRPPYPDNYRPGLFADSMLSTDTNIGFSGGDVMPLIPGSRFRVFDH